MQEEQSTQSIFRSRAPDKVQPGAGPASGPTGFTRRDATQVQVGQTNKASESHEAEDWLGVARNEGEGEGEGEGVQKQ